MRSLAVALIWFGLCPLIFVSPFVGVLLFSWLSFMSPQREVWGFAETVPWALIFALATFAAWFTSREPKRLPMNPTTILLLAFMGAFTVSTIFSLDFALSFEKWNLTIRAFFFLLVTIALTTNRVRVQALVWVMVLSIGFYGVKGGGGALLGGGAFRVYGPDSTVIGDNNHVAVAFLVTLPLMNYLRVVSVNRLVQLGLLGAMGLTLLAALSSYSRGALLAAAAMGLFLCLKSQRKIATLVVVGVAGIAGIAFMPESWYERMHSIQDYKEDASATGRLDMWRMATAIALSRPLTGGGFKVPYKQDVVDRYDPSVHARAVHSIYFELLGECGFVALAIWGSILVVAWRNASWIIRSSRSSPPLAWAGEFARMAQVSMVSYLVGGAFLSLSYWDFLFTILGLLAVTRGIVAKELEEKPRAEPKPEVAWTPVPVRRSGRSLGGKSAPHPIPR